MYFCCVRCVLSGIVITSLGKRGGGGGGGWGGMAIALPSGSL